MIGLLEIDITDFREKIWVLRRQNTSISFTGCIIKIIADCVAANKQVGAALLNDRKLVIFDDVDISISIERQLNNGYFPYPLIIRCANTKTVPEIDREIKNAVDKPVEKETDIFMPEKPMLGKLFLNLFYGIPSKIRVFAMESMIKNPVRARQLIGTVGFATVNLGGRLSGWVFPDKNPYSLYIALGSVTKKPVVVKNEVRIREVLNMTVIFDHNVIDGTPARSFMNTLVNSIEKGEIKVS